MSGEKGHTVPWAIAHASFTKQRRNQGITESVEMKGRGHALTIDGGRREVADTALTFVRRLADAAVWRSGPRITGVPSNDTPASLGADLWARPRPPAPITAEETLAPCLGSTVLLTPIV